MLLSTAVEVYAGSVNVLILGSGAREHALAWKLSESKRLTRLWCMPGNPGIARHAECLQGSPVNVAAVLAAAEAHRIDLVVVGPEAPLVAGVADALRAQDILVFGPDQAAAAIEGSKAFAKEVMHRAGVPTARAEVFDDLEAAAQRAEAWGAVVVKADGLAAGKGVVVADSGAEAAAAVRVLGSLPAGGRILLEERLTGPELSLIALTDGSRFAVLPGAHDFKRLGDGDIGPNTGGMGAFAPTPLVDAAGLQRLGDLVIAPILKELARRGTPFCGALYAGLMLTRSGPMVIEYNCRFGDPETQPLMMLLDEDLLTLLEHCAKGALDVASLKTKAGAVVAVGLAAAGYPGTPRAGDTIEGLGEHPANVQVFHAGTRDVSGRLVTAGGRVLTVCALANDVAHARSDAYDAAERIRFDGAQLRRDIALKMPVLP